MLSLGVSERLGCGPRRCATLSGLLLDLLFCWLLLPCPARCSGRLLNLLRWLLLGLLDWLLLDLLCWLLRRLLLVCPTRVARLATAGALLPRVVTVDVLVALHFVSVLRLFARRWWGKIVANLLLDNSDKRNAVQLIGRSDGHPSGDVTDCRKSRICDVHSGLVLVLDVETIKQLSASVLAALNLHFELNIASRA